MAYIELHDGNGAPITLDADKIFCFYAIPHKENGGCKTKLIIDTVNSKVAESGIRVRENYAYIKFVLPKLTNKRVEAFKQH